MNTFFTSDFHFFHKNIIKHCNRPFGSIDEMNESLISNYNSKIVHKDLVYLLGDISFGNKIDTNILLKRLKGKKILIVGNHDKQWLNQENKKLFQEIYDLRMIKINKQKIVLCHFPIEYWQDKKHDSFHFHGHLHGNFKNPANRIDVGVDCHNYYPMEYEELKKLL